MAFDVRLGRENPIGVVDLRLSSVSVLARCSGLLRCVVMNSPLALLLTASPLLPFMLKRLGLQLLISSVSAMLLLTESMDIYRGITASAHPALRIDQGMRGACREELEVWLQPPRREPIQFTMNSHFRSEEFCEPIGRLDSVAI